MADVVGAAGREHRVMTDVVDPHPHVVPTSRTAPRRRRRSPWLAPAGLILLCLVPVVAGASRVSQLSTGATVTAENARFFDSPIPVVVHIVSATVFGLLGALQFAAPLRRPRRPGGVAWHRRAGTVLLPAGVLVALSGLWMALFYPWPAGDGVVLFVLRLVFGSAMLASIALAVRALVVHDYSAHGAWMTRAYAIALGAGTQVLTTLPWVLIVGHAPDEATRAVLMGAGWVINLAVAEYVIRRRSHRRPTLSAARAPLS
jgi:hypothetical protein